MRVTRSRPLTQAKSNEGMTGCIDICNRYHEGIRLSCSAAEVEEAASGRGEGGYL